MTPRTLTALIFICLATLVAPASATSTDPSRSRIALAEITDGATLDGLLAEMGLLRNQRANIANALGRSISPRKLRPGQWLAVRFGDDAETFDALVVHLGRGRRAVVTKQDTGYSSDLFDPDNSDIERTERFKIKRSLAKDAQDSGVPNAVIAQLTQALDTHVSRCRPHHLGLRATQAPGSGRLAPTQRHRLRRTARHPGLRQCTGPRDLRRPPARLRPADRDPPQRRTQHTLRPPRGLRRRARTRPDRGRRRPHRFGRPERHRHRTEPAFRNPAQRRGCPGTTRRRAPPRSRSGRLHTT